MHSGYIITSIMGTSKKLLSSKIIYIIESSFTLYIVPTREHPKEQFLEVPLFYWAIVTVK